MSDSFEQISVGLLTGGDTVRICFPTLELVDWAAVLVTVLEGLTVVLD